MKYAKYIDTETIIPCPRNGYAEGKVISNLSRYFSENPMVAEKEGYLPFVPLTETVNGSKYEIVDGTIREIEIT